MAAGCHLSLVRWTLESLVPMGSTPSTSSSIRGVSSPVSSSASSRANRACTSRYSVVLWCLAHYDTVQSMPVSLRDHSMHKVCCVSTQASKPLRLLGFALHDASAMFWWLRVLSEATNLLKPTECVLRCVLPQERLFCVKGNLVSVVLVSGTCIQLAWLLRSFMHSIIQRSVHDGCYVGYIIMQSSI